MNFDTICNILSSDAFISVNKTLAKKIGIIPAVVLAELISEQRYWTIRKELTSDGYFFSTISNLEENCGIKRSQQDTAIQVLIEKNLISYQVKKYPRRRFFKINNKKLTRGFLETIASQWKRLNIETVEETRKEAEKEYKKSKKTNTLSNFNTGKNVKEEVLPDWFNQSIKKEEISADDEKSLKDMLKEFS